MLFHKPKSQIESNKDRVRSYRELQGNTTYNINILNVKSCDYSFIPARAVWRTPTKKKHHIVLHFVPDSLLLPDTMRRAHKEPDFHSLVHAELTPKQGERGFAQESCNKFSQVVPDYGGINWVRGHAPAFPLSLGACCSGQLLRDSK